MAPHRDAAKRYVSFVVDDALNGRALGADPHATIRDPGEQYRYGSVLVGWHYGLGPLFVAVHSCLDSRLDDAEASELARDYLAECIWFPGAPTDPDYIIR